MKIEWWERAECLKHDPEIFFPKKGGTANKARKVCAVCPVRVECLNYAIAHDEQHGVWGGTTERERRRLKRLAVEAA